MAVVNKIESGNHWQGCGDVVTLCTTGRNATKESSVAHQKIENRIIRARYGPDNCNPSYSGGRDRRITLQGWPLAKARHCPKNKLKQKGLGTWLEW
jgi:hypothetical protein